MHGKATILLGLMLAIAAMPMANATHHPSTACNPTESVHGYFGSSGTYTGSHPPPVVFDNCSDIVNYPEGDGEYELGMGGARFPAGTSLCVWNAHHSYGVGALYRADAYRFDVAYTVGADGPALVQDPTQPIPCGTDGIISDNPVIDPLDCGSGEMGFYAPGNGVWTPATLKENIPGNGACNPYDGIVWGWTWTGVFFTIHGVVISNPADGHFWG